MIIRHIKTHRCIHWILRLDRGFHQRIKSLWKASTWPVYRIWKLTQLCLFGLRTNERIKAPISITNAIQWAENLRV
jgi:hypothetical protein